MSAYPAGVISSDAPLGLGSASPRRRELLNRVGIPLLIVPVEIDERPLADEAATEYLERIVDQKLADAVAQERARAASVILVADTVVLLDGEILGKPHDRAHAQEMLARLSGRVHQVSTRFALARPRDPVALHAETVATCVEIRHLDNDEIRRYVATGEGADKAGAYAIQGIGSFAVSRVEGSYTNVVGLPVCEVVMSLQRLGFLGDFP
jgi:nucleoside triphosphate pyrophosphatase